MSWLSGLFGKRRQEKELEEEVRSHLEMAARERAERGEKEEEAEHAARREFGNVGLVVEVTKDIWGWRWLRDLADDARYGLRMLTKNPGFTAVAVLTLALGIGANAAIFNTANAVLWRTLPVADPQSLVRLIAVRQDHRESNILPVGVAEELRRSGIFFDVITRTDDGLSFSYNGSGAERVVGEVVSPNFFAFLGVRPVHGQGFSVGVQKGQWAPEVVLSYRFWQRRFGSDPQVLGHNIRLNNYPFAIVGVSPPDFYSLVVGFDPELRVPEMPVLVGLAGVVLLVTAFNLTGMLLARATTRRRELAVRAAIGAGRSRLIRQMFTESALLAMAAGAVGLAIMSSTGNTILRFLPQGHINMVLDLSPDLRTLWFTAGLTILAGVVIGLVPSLQSTGNNVSLGLKSDSAASIGDAKGGIFRQALTIGQVALSLLLLTIAGLFERSLANLRAADPFPQPDRVLLFRMKPQKEFYDGQRIRTLTADVVRRMSTLPGVELAALAEEGPYGSRGAMRSAVHASDGRTVDADMDIVSPGLFATLGIPLFNGRDFSERDNERSKAVVVVDELLAQRLFGSSNPIGKMIEAPVQGNDVAFEIIGVVRSSRYYDLHQTSPPMIFYNLQQAGPYMPTLHVRVSSANPETVVSEVRREFGVIDRNVPIFDIRTLRDRVLGTLAQQRLVSDLAGAFGALALSLVAVGLYGLMAFSVAQRTREIGIRAALGADRKRIMTLVAWQGMRIVFIGVALGLPASFLLTRLMAGMLYNVHPDDPLSFATETFVLSMVSLLACYIPARTATKVDPMVALRYE
ncbi:MAG: hypothetical protein DMG54_04120 [Acidobacteria bacterium]|nr:MAG: hypothetical protein DMG54_04120 [Acidobacteriota bacterium]